jgi:hypothetical protein
LARHNCAAAVLALAIVIATAVTVHAEVGVNGDTTAVRVDATQSNVAEILSALESAFQFRVNTSVVLDRAVSGTFTGSLAQVLSRLLEGHNYFIRRQATEIEVTVIGMQGDRAVAVEPPRPPSAYSLAAGWRGLTNNTKPRKR